MGVKENLMEDRGQTTGPSPDSAAGLIKLCQIGLPEFLGLITSVIYSACCVMQRIFSSSWNAKEEVSHYQVRGTSNAPKKQHS